jgi:P-type E1-E2 ATPase
MIDIVVPGHAGYAFQHLVLDYNGTLACDGELIPGVAVRLEELASRVRVHVLTADTFGKARDALLATRCELTIIAPSDQASAKRDYIVKLLPAQTIAIGNGRNDCLMLKEATLGIAVVGPEGVSAETLAAADVVAPHVLAALDLLLHPLRLVATLRG